MKRLVCNPVIFVDMTTEKKGYEEMEAEDIFCGSSACNFQLQHLAVIAFYVFLLSKGV